MEIDAKTLCDYTLNVIQTVTTGIMFAANPQAYLGNSILHNQDIAPLDCHDLEGDNQMAMKRERVQIGTDLEGKPIYKWAMGDSNKAFHESIVKLFIENGLLSALMGGAPPAPSSPKIEGKPFREYAEEWFRTYKKPKLRYNTLLGYETNLEKHIYPAFDGKMLDGIFTVDIQAFYNRLSADGMAKSTIHKQGVMLHQIFSSAIEDGYIKKNPTESDRLTIPSTKEEKRNALQESEIQDIIKNISKLTDNQERMLLALLIFTGMRRGEALGLMWEDIDFSEKIITVSRAITFQHNRGVVGLTKSVAGNREIPLLPELEQILLPLKSTGFVIQKNGEPISEQTFRRMWERIEKKVDLHSATPHILRHSFATVLSNAGVDIKSIQAIIGHADISTTMETYVHSQTKQVKKAADKVKNVFSPL